MKIGTDFKYLKINNFLSKDEINLLKTYFIIRHKCNINNFDSHQTNLETHFYADPLTESLLLRKKHILENESGLELLPTYSFSRVYTKFADLKKHIDRPSCEVSVTVCVDSCGEDWPIYMNGKPIILKPGDAAMYLGCEVEHWREEFMGDYQSQFFLHYVDKNGKNKEYALDSRPFIGAPPESKKN